MSLSSGKYWTGDPDIKPEAWGPVEAVQAAIHENADSIYGIAPDTIRSLCPFWESAGETIRDYSKNNLNIVFDNGTPSWEKKVFI